MNGSVNVFADTVGEITDNMIRNRDDDTRDASPAFRSPIKPSTKTSTIRSELYLWLPCSRRFLWNEPRSDNLTLSEQRSEGLFLKGCVHRLDKRGVQIDIKVQLRSVRTNNWPVERKSQRWAHMALNHLRTPYQAQAFAALVGATY